MDTPLTDEQKKFTQQIKTSSESLLVLINDILDLTKIEAGAYYLPTYRPTYLPTYLLTYLSI
jgi:signal transduction histidine kinase